MIIRCCFPCLHISDWQMKIHDHREIDLSLWTYMIELWISAVECWISIVNHEYPLSFAFGFPCIPIYWLYQDCYLFITWSKRFARVKNKKNFHSYIYMGWNIDIQHCYALRNRQEKYFERLAQLLGLSAAIYLDRFELGYRIFQYWSDSETEIIRNTVRCLCSCNTSRNSLASATEKMIRFDTETLMCRFDTDSYYKPWCRLLTMPRVSSGQGKGRKFHTRQKSGNCQGILLWVRENEKCCEKSGNFERVMAMVVSWVIWNILDNILIHCWWSCWHQWLGCQAPMIYWIFHWCQISFVILFAKLCLNSYGTRVNQCCESNVTRGQGKVREKSGSFIRGNCWTPRCHVMYTVTTRMCLTLHVLSTSWVTYV